MCEISPVQLLDQERGKSNGVNTKSLEQLDDSCSHLFFADFFT